MLANQDYAYPAISIALPSNIVENGGSMLDFNGGKSSIDLLFEDY